MRALKSLILCCAALSGALAQANGGHFQVDDASVTPAKQCQLSTWISRHSPDTDWTLEPGCNFTGSSAWYLPMEYSLERDELHRIGLEYKRVLWNWTSGPAMAGLLGTEYSRQAEELDTFYAKVPLSFQPLDNLSLHLNGGVEHSRVLDDTYATWGLAATIKPVHGPIWILEATDNERRREPIYGLGWRTNIGSTTWTLDFGVQRDTLHEETTYNLGINIPRLF